MHCSNCGYTNDGGKFCIQCGSKLVEMVQQQDQTESAVGQPVPTAQTYQTQQPTNGYHQAAAMQQHPPQPNVYIEKSKVVSRMYFQFFLSALKKPVKMSETVNQTDFINGCITLGLFSLLIPLITYLGMGDAKEYLDSPFLNFVLKPFFVLLVFCALISGAMLIAVKLGKDSANYKDVVARFGTVMVAPLALIIVGLLFALLGSTWSILFTLLGASGVYFIIPFIIYSFSKNERKGLDPLYGTVITYIVIGIMFVIFGGILLETIVESFDSMIEEIMYPFSFL